MNVIYLQTCFIHSGRLRESRAAAMSLPAAASGFLVLLLTAPVIQGQDVWGVSYSSTEVCALKGSTVQISCTIRYPSVINGLKTQVEETFWFTKDSNGVLVDLRTDPEYSGRVTSLCEDKVCSLRITELRESDSAEYKFRFTTNQPGGTYTGSPGVSLSVTDLQVQVSRLTVYSYYNWELTCQSSCLPPGGPLYVWYKNGQNIRGQTSKSYSGYFYPADSASCAVGGYENFPSPPVLIWSHNKWGVTYTPTEVCAFKGSAVNLHCSYTYPSTGNSAVQKTFWFTEEKHGEPVDLTTDRKYSGRVQVRCSEKRCSLMIRDLRETDSAEYKFMFTTDQPEYKYSGSPGVSLSVTDPQLQIKVRRSPVHLSPTWTELTCHTRCQLPEDSSFIWYQNGEKGTEGKVYFHPNPLNPADHYSCAIKGHEMFPSPSVYAPKLPSVSVSPSAEIVEGSSVTLTCSSDANPAANYTWYKEDEDSPKASGHIFIITDITAEHSGNYYCEAQNTRGHHHSTVHLTVVAGNSTSMMIIIRSTLVVLMLIPLLLLSLWTRKKKALSSAPEPHEPEEIELDSGPEYQNVSDMAAQTEDPEEQEDRV